MVSQAGSALARQAPGPGRTVARTSLLFADHEDGLALPRFAGPAGRLARTTSTAASSSGVGTPRVTASSGAGSLLTASVMLAQPLDLPTPRPNWRCTLTQNASRSHSRASW